MSNPEVPNILQPPPTSNPLPALRRRVAVMASTAWRHRDIRAFCSILLAIDLVCIGFYAITRTLRAHSIDIGVFARPEFRITVEHGYPEIFGYGKLLLIIVVLAWLTRSTRQPVYLALTLLFGLILLDDSFVIHESLGGVFARSLHLTPAFGVTAQPQGELLAWAALGALALPLLAVGLWRSAPADRLVGAALLLPVAAIGVFAVGVDALYSPLKDSFVGAGLLLDTLEDGGELVSITAACAMTLASGVTRAGAVRNPPRSGPP